MVKNTRFLLYNYLSIPWQNTADGTGEKYPNYNGTFIFGVPNYNVGNGYNATTGTFTAPIAGYYHFSYMIVADIDKYHNVNDIGFAINGSFVGENVSAVTSFYSWDNRQLGSSTNDAIFYLNIGDTVSLMRVCCDNTQPYDWRGNFTGYIISSLVGPQGPQGATGPAGPQGPQGATGPATKTTAICSSAGNNSNADCNCTNKQISKTTSTSSCSVTSDTGSCTAYGATGANTCGFCQTPSYPTYYGSCCVCGP